MTINAKKRPSRTTTRDPKKWIYWGGKKPLNAEYIAKQATKLFFKCGYNSFKFLKVKKTEKRRLLGTMRYRVQYLAQRCEEEKVSKPGKKNKKRKPQIEIKFKKCYKDKKMFQAIFRDNVIHNSLRLNVTNLENGNSCALVIKY